MRSEGMTPTIVQQEQEQQEEDQRVVMSQPGQKSHLHLHISCFLVMLSISMVAGMAPLPIALQVEAGCEDSVNLSYQPNPPLPAGLRIGGAVPSDNRSWSSCEVRYWSVLDREDVGTVRVLYDYPSSLRRIHIANLSRHSTYIFYMACDQHFQSNNVTFTAGAACEGEGEGEGSVLVKQGQDHPHSYDTPTLLRENGLTQMSSVDITLGIIFGIFGTVILAAAAFYLWKNYLHRQRILRLFVQEYRDPFQALTNMEESSIISL